MTTLYTGSPALEEDIVSRAPASWTFNRRSSSLALLRILARSCFGKDGSFRGSTKIYQRRIATQLYGPSVEGVTPKSQVRTVGRRTEDLVTLGYVEVSRPDGGGGNIYRLTILSLGLLGSCTRRKAREEKEGPTNLSGGTDNTVGGGRHKSAPVPGKDSREGHSGRKAAPTRSDFGDKGHSRGSRRPHQIPECTWTDWLETLQGWVRGQGGMLLDVPDGQLCFGIELALVWAIGSRPPEDRIKDRAAWDFQVAHAQPGYPEKALGWLLDLETRSARKEAPMRYLQKVLGDGPIKEAIHV